MCMYVLMRTGPVFCPHMWSYEIICAEYLWGSSFFIVQTCAISILVHGTQSIMPCWCLLCAPCRPDFARKSMPHMWVCIHSSMPLGKHGKGWYPSLRAWGPKIRFSHASHPPYLDFASSAHHFFRHLVGRSQENVFKEAAGQGGRLMWFP